MSCVHQSPLGAVLRGLLAAAAGARLPPNELPAALADATTAG